MTLAHRLIEVPTLPDDFGGEHIDLVSGLTSTNELGERSTCMVFTHGSGDSVDVSLELRAIMLMTLGAWSIVRDIERMRGSGHCSSARMEELEGCGR